MNTYIRVFMFQFIKLDLKKTINCISEKNLTRMVNNTAN